MKQIFILFILALSFNSYANNGLISVSFGDQNLGRSRVDLDLHDFKLIIKKKLISFEAAFYKNSVQWVRTSSNLLTPRARIGLKIDDDSNDIHIKYGGKVIIPEKKNGNSFLEIFVSLFNPGDLEIYKGQKLVGLISTQAKIKNTNKKTKLIDYSCSKFNLVFEGLEHEYMSIGCRLERKGSWGSETPRLEVTWSATNYQLEDGARPPFTVFLHDSSPAKINVVDQLGVKKTITIKAKLPKRLRRLKTAFGLGPYMFKAHEDQKSRKESISPAVMLYGKLDLNKTSSIRAFNATVFNESIFSNTGLYFAYQLADILDGRIEIVPLLGMQGLYYKYNKESQPRNKAIYPQGFEILYKNAFGIENYNVIYGTFLSTSSKEKYKNLWLRWGKGYFWELNYISWSVENLGAQMWGLSIGLPLASWF